MTEPVGYVCLMLHAHLPFVRHPEHEDFLEEDWLFEAITETYIPLLQAFERLDADRVPYRVTMGLTPPLAAMLGDPLLQSRYRRHLAKQRDLVAREVRGNPADTPIGQLARFYRALLAETHAVFEERWGGNLLEAFRAARDRGSVELITCTATHAFLPLLQSERGRRAQVRVGCEAFRRTFGRQPRGIWLGECAYVEGVDRLLAEQGVEYFFLDGHGILFGEPRPAFGVFAPVSTPAGVFALGRDTDSARQVWSSKEGYPGDPWYREFYRDLGYDAAYPYIRRYLHQDGVRRGVGIKYHRVTGEVALHDKAYYQPAVALERAALHASHFAASRVEQARKLRERMDRPPLMVAPYDAELFGHWWFEGPLFLENFFRQAAQSGELQTVTATDYLARHPSVQRQEPCASTWGAEGYSKVWLNGANAQIYRHLHHAERQMEALTDRFPAATGARKQALDQAARELLLAQSSDWAFIVTSATAVPYAVRRVREHLDRFQRLAAAIESDTLPTVDPGAAPAVEPIFPWLDYRVFAAGELPDPIVS